MTARQYRTFVALIVVSWVILGVTSVRSPWASWGDEVASVAALLVLASLTVFLGYIIGGLHSFEKLSGLLDSARHEVRDARNAIAKDFPGIDPEDVADHLTRVITDGPLSKRVQVQVLKQSQMFKVK